MNVAETMIQNEARRKHTAAEKIPLSEPVYFVVENLPPISSLRRIAKNQKTKIIAIEREEWELSVIDTEDNNSLRKSEGMKEILLSRVKANGDDLNRQLGIFTDANFKLILGVIGNNVSLRLDRPVSLAKMVKEIKNEQQTE